MLFKRVRQKQKGKCHAGFMKQNKNSALIERIQYLKPTDGLCDSKPRSVCQHDARPETFIRVEDLSGRLWGQHHPLILTICFVTLIFQPCTLL